MLIVTILWDPSAAHVTLDSLEMEQHVLVDMITLFGKYDTLLSMKVGFSGAPAREARQRSTMGNKIW